VIRPEDTTRVTFTDSPPPQADSANLRTRSALLKANPRIDVTLDFYDKADFVHIERLDMLLNLFTALRERCTENSAWEDILAVNRKAGASDDTVSVIDEPFTVGLDAAKRLAILRASIGPDRTFDKVRYKQALNRFDSEIFHSSLLAQCLMSSLNSAGKAAIQAANELLRHQLQFNLMQDSLWVFIWIVTSIMPSWLMYTKSLQLAEDKLQLNVPAASRTTQDYRKFLHDVARVSHHISDHTTLISKILAFFTPNKDTAIQHHLGAFRHLIRHSPDTVDIHHVIYIFMMLLTSVEEAVIEDQVALSSTRPSADANLDIMAMPAIPTIAALQQQIQSLQQAVQQANTAALYIPGSCPPARHSDNCPKPPCANPPFFGVPPPEGQTTQSKTWTDPHSNTLKTFFWCAHFQLWICKLDGHQTTHYTGHPSDLPCFKDKPTRKPAGEANHGRPSSANSDRRSRGDYRCRDNSRNDNRRTTSSSNDRSASRTQRNFSNYSSADAQAILANPDLMAAIAVQVRDVPK
jgi:hypothetical protein